jgi:serine/threonine protein phosphatase 1
MSLTFNIIGDIAGRYDEFMQLLDKMPQASVVIGLGDLVDRGPKSKDVVEWFCKHANGRALALLGNHEVMTIEAYRDYPGGGHPYWDYNGGDATMKSYDYGMPPERHLQFLESLPMWFAHENLFISHAPVRDTTAIPGQFADWRTLVDNESNFVWNRYLDRRPMKDKFMVYGHNSHFVEHKYVDQEGQLIHYATCLDNSREKELIGMHWPSRKLFKVPYAG